MSPGPMWILWGYVVGIFPVWIAGAARIGFKLTKTPTADADFDAALERVLAAFRNKMDNWDFNYHIAGNARGLSDNPKPTPMQVWIDAASSFAIGLLWPLALPIYLAFNKGKTVGLKRRQMKHLLKEAQDEIERIRKEEGWVKS